MGDADLEGYLKSLKAIARRRLCRLGLAGSKADASSVVQGVFLKAIENGVANEREPLAALAEIPLAVLHTATANAATDKYRHFHSGKRDVGREQPAHAAAGESDSGPAEQVAADQPSPSQLAEQNENQARLANAIQQLPERERRVVELVYSTGWTQKEIAVALAMTPAQINGLYTRGLKQLVDKLRPQE